MYIQTKTYLQSPSTSVRLGLINEGGNQKLVLVHSVYDEAHVAL